MNFDIKDVKSWANRHDVKVGDVGYVTCDFNHLLTNKATLVTKATVKDIDNNDSRCFLAQPLNRKVIFHYGFFLPLEAVKEDKPKEKKYRPFKTIRELEDALNQDNTSTPQAICVGEDIFVRSKQDHNRVEEMLITSVIRKNETNEVLSINACPPSYLFERYEIRVGSKWLPFGVEVEDDEG